MSNIEGLKEQARRHEQKEEWRKALDLYQRAIQRLAEEDAPDIGLYNRVGDLFTRVGEVDEAVRAFEQAVELYVESELPNNAIAVCKKILRNVPDRHEVFLRMGQIRAAQGFLVDARTHFLTYAERTQAAGELDEALRALVEFADAAQDDTEIRLAIAAHFQQHERVDEAVEQLVEGYRAAVRQELDDDVAVFVERLAELRPGVDPEELARGQASPEDGDADADEAVDAVHPFDQDGPYAGVAEEASPADDEAVVGIDAPVTGGSSGEWDFGDARPLDESGAADDEVEFGVDEVDVARADAFEEARTEASDEVETAGVDEDGAIPAMDDVFGVGSSEAEAEAPDSDAMDDAISAIGPDVSRFGRLPDESNPLEGFDVVDEDDDDDDLPLPLTRYDDEDDADVGALEVDESDEVGEWDDDEDLDAELPFLHVPPEVSVDDETPADDADEPDEDETEAWAGADAESPAEGDDPWAEAVEDARSEAGADDADDADELAARIAEAPDDLELRQRAVELAHRSGDDRALADAYVGLGEALRRTGAEVRAQAVFREALQLDADHAAARAALSGAPEPERDVAEVASNEDYVDLGAMILGEDDEKTTRFVVAYEEPSGDEQADFAKMLTQFKAKVAENVDASDVKAHHDLGTAYKEMGLLDEAVEEFQAALRASADHLPTYEMLGQTFLERGTPETAVRVLSRALDVEYEVEDELLGIYYCLGRSHETIGNTEQAVEFYERVFSLDINFADVTERLRALR